MVIVFFIFTLLIFQFQGFVLAKISLDVSEGSYYYDAVEYLHGKGWAEGYGDGTFGIEKKIQRDQFLKIIVNVVLEDNLDSISNSCDFLGSDENIFPDVAKGDLYEKYMCFGKAREYISGYSSGEFKPKNFITVGEASKIIANVVLGYKLGDQTTTKSKFYPYLYELEKLNVLPPTLISESSFLNRGDMAEIIMRISAGITDKNSLKAMDLLLEQVVVPSGELYTGEFVRLDRVPGYGDITCPLATYFTDESTGKIFLAVDENGNNINDLSDEFFTKTVYIRGYQNEINCLVAGCGCTASMYLTEISLVPIIDMYEESIGEFGNVEYFRAKYGEEAVKNLLCGDDVVYFRDAQTGGFLKAYDVNGLPNSNVKEEIYGRKILMKGVKNTITCKALACGCEISVDIYEYEVS